MNNSMNNSMTNTEQATARPPTPTATEAYEALKVLNRWLTANDALRPTYNNFWYAISNKVVKAATKQDLRGML